MAAESANAMTRDRAGLIPTAAAAVSLPRSASRYLPVVPRRMSDDERPDDGQHHDGEDEERVVVVDEPGPWHLLSGRRPPPIQSMGTRMLSNMSANASVASAR